MIRVILNADDFGLSEGVCEGIVRSMETGCLTSTTAMICVPGARDRLARWAPRIPRWVGAHLQLTSGRPVLPPEQVPSLTGEHGAFPAKRKQLKPALQADEIFAEWTAQLEAIRRLGIAVTHLDSHHHVHRLPEAFDAITRIALRTALPVRPVNPEMADSLRKLRIPCVDRTVLEWYGGELTPSSLTQRLLEGTRGLNSGAWVELMCHPGFVDETLREHSGYVEEREKEFDALVHPQLPNRLADAGFLLDRYTNLRGEQLLSLRGGGTNGAYVLPASLGPTALEN